MEGHLAGYKCKILNARMLFDTNYSVIIIMIYNLESHNYNNINKTYGYSSQYCPELKKKKKRNKITK